MAVTPPDSAKFWSRIDPCRTDGCWLWFGAVDKNGYGTFSPRANGKMPAHEFLVGRAGSGKYWKRSCHELDESCHGGVTDPHRRCVNPDHLVLKSVREKRPHVRQSRSTGTAEERFWSRVDPCRTDDCWVWTGAVDRQGFGSFSKSRNERINAHTFLVGPAGPGRYWRRLCHERDASCPGGPGDPHRLCVNPEHLVAADWTDNRTYLGARNAHKTHCPQGHAYDEANTYVSREGFRYCKACEKQRKQRLRKYPARGRPRKPAHVA